MLRLCRKANRSPTGCLFQLSPIRLHLAQPERVRQPKNALPSCHHTVIHRVLLEKPLHGGRWLHVNTEAGNVPLLSFDSRQGLPVEHSWRRRHFLRYGRQTQQRYIGRIPCGGAFKIPEATTELRRKLNEAAILCLLTRRRIRSTAKAACALGRFKNRRDRLPHVSNGDQDSLATRAQSETRDEDLISNGFHKVAQDARAQKLNGISGITGAYLSFGFYKETT